MPRGAHLMIQDGDEVGPGRRAGEDPEGDARAPRTSPAVCRASSNCSKPASRARRPSSARSMAWFASAKSPRVSARSTSRPTTATRRSTRFLAVSTSTCRKANAFAPATRSWTVRCNPHDILAVLGEKELQAYLVNEIQEVYRLQGVAISRQAHRGDRSPDAPLGQDRRSGRHQLPARAAGRSLPLPRRERARRQGTVAVRQSVVRCCSASPRRRSRPTASSPRPASRRPLAYSPKPASTARSTTCAASRRTSSSAASSPPARAWSTTATSSSHPELEEAAARVQQEVSAENEAAERELELMRQEGEAEEMAAE